ncbi:MAG: VWA domain-containing protein [Candidatus Methanomethylophilaceae archaeon]|nr:VWA domain-containing protein [Candidatus Methanomethylophilaceae archaeon]
MPERTLTGDWEGIIGLDDAKTAFLCMMIDPQIKGLIIRGPAGIGKTRLSRAMAAGSGMETYNLPLNATEEQTFGSLDIDAALRSGTMRVEPGILGRAEHELLCIDDVNLFDRKFIHTVMQAIESGRVRIERDGLSDSYECNVTVVATVNSREVALNRNVSDLFDMSVTVVGSTDPDFRVAVMRENLFDDMRDDVISEDTKKRVAEARELLPEVRISDDMMYTIIDGCVRMGVKGYRGELSSIRVSKALAALNGHRDVTLEDVYEGMYLCLAHRRERNFQWTEKKPNEVNFYTGSHIKRFIHDERKANLKKDEPEQVAGINDEVDAVVSEVETMMSRAAKSRSPELEEVVVKVGEKFESIDLLEESRKDKLDKTLMRKTISDDGKDGRYTSSRPMTRPSTDIAFDATVRAAAPYQPLRRQATGRDGVIIEKSDLYEKVREKHTSCLLMFMVDNSGSLVIRGRMRAVKAAILSMLEDHYVRRDSVALMTFNEQRIGMDMAPTRSVGGVKKVLDTISTGRKTPMSEAILYASNFVSAYLMKHKGEHCYIILMTDGGANIPLEEGNDPFEESLRIASNLKMERTGWIVVDTKANPEPDSKAFKLSAALGAPYYVLDELKSTEQELGKPHT